jgi:hypothetical protein
LVTIAAGRADEIAGGSWFTGYAEHVDLYDGLYPVDDFDADARAARLRHPEHALFGGGLDVRGTLNLADGGYHSIYVVRGSLHARRMNLGDAVLVVQGDIEVDEWLFGGTNEGVFEVRSNMFMWPGDADDMLRHIRAPLVAVLTKYGDGIVLRDRGVARDVNELLPELLDDDRRDGVNEELLRERVLGGAQIFR